MGIAHIATLGLAALSATATSASGVESVVRAPAGAVRGTLTDGQHVFKGIPYALYYFDHGYPAADDARMHGFHASEVPYVFGTIHRTTALWPTIPDTVVERDLSTAMVDYWASFAQSGVPTARNQPAWPAHNKESAYMIFAGKPQVATDLMPGQYQLHDQVVCRRRAVGNIPWNWNVGVTAPLLPPAQETCR